MSKETITFRLDQEKRTALDEIAEGMDRDRSYILNEAIDLYLDVHRWQVNTSWREYSRQITRSLPPMKK